MGLHNIKHAAAEQNDKIKDCRPAGTPCPPPRRQSSPAAAPAGKWTGTPRRRRSCTPSTGSPWVMGTGGGPFAQMNYQPSQDDPPRELSDKPAGTRLRDKPLGVLSNITNRSVRTPNYGQPLAAVISRWGQALRACP